MTVRIGTAPISWGVCEIPGWGPQLPVDRVLDEMQAAGYEGTELGPWGFLPTDPGELASALSRRGLALAAAFVPLALRDPGAYAQGEASVRATAELLRRLGAGHILLADAGDPSRYEVAGRPALTAVRGLRAGEWAGYTRRLEQLAQICRFDYGLVPCFHSHGGTYIENPTEIATLLERTDPHLVKFCLDTGHVAFGGGDPLEVTRRYAARIGYVHLKDIDLPRLGTLLAAGQTYVGAAQQDVFVELGRGSLDLAALLGALREAAYEGWIIVEQDRVVDAETDTLGSARRSRAYLRERLGV
ncbi:MAG: TIM barrel protein [Armatimonadota bacterium]|nr:TIM barrel protein [Armatimonadota bacterium]MDR7422436.1 TIM barrel protein [Armatimonadota bacterium]MDR7457078.1 TIM barrel protein [Armatimonadota bacterium]MDR7496942.1 TIM barrel protein [Armatimonadota bacterium]MDR7512413.1 TIM barrel protein [Armatimonadota bacterium]